MITAINSSLQSQQKIQPIKRNNLNLPNKSKSDVSFGIVPYSPEFYAIAFGSATILSVASIIGIHYLAKIFK